MDKHRNKKYSNNWKNQNKNNRQNNEPVNKKEVFQFNKANYENEAANKERQQAIVELKKRENVCPMCNQIITDIPSSMCDKATGVPVHFECALNKVKETEPTGENEKVAYIGQGRFAVLAYENIRDQRHFTIKKIIDWEERDKKSEWRTEYSEIYSKIN